MVTYGVGDIGDWERTGDAQTEVVSPACQTIQMCSVPCRLRQGLVGMEGTHASPWRPFFEFRKLAVQLMNGDVLRGAARAPPIMEYEPHILFVSRFECDPAVSTICHGWDSSFLGSVCLSSRSCLY